uniref:EAL domain-containing protein n=2 Tax=Burkholderiales TaxID=80840 RepID=A0A6B9HE36_9BURK|nr:hypothetical protein [Mycetohabitans sp.]
MRFLAELAEDRSLVHRADAPDTQSAVLVDAIIAMAHVLKPWVTTESVEIAEQARLLGE